MQISAKKFICSLAFNFSFTVSSFSHFTRYREPIKFEISFENNCTGPFNAGLFNVHRIRLFLGCGKPNDTNSSVPDKDDVAKYFLHRKVSDVSIKKIEAFCGDCHGMPRVASFPISHWRKEVERGFEFYDMSGRSDLDPPNLYDTIAYFTQKAESEKTFFEKVNNVAASQKLKSLFEDKENDQAEDSGIANILLPKCDPGTRARRFF